MCVLLLCFCDIECLCVLSTVSGSCFFHVTEPIMI
ncbi:unnamed protein product [Brassica rapa]|uniref:Uncharacterized protein n=2 Tax=Brassica TaxID=3705 RepID=A0A8D9HBX4_BRACM|nr:unnamed protein product [Brassica napus]CAG7896518.1 unnamed protein product [Brassica rapa]